MREKGGENEMGFPVLLLAIGAAMVLWAVHIDTKSLPKEPLTEKEIEEESEDFIGFLFGGAGSIALAICMLISKSLQI